jgi:hypothetical protein
MSLKQIVGIKNVLVIRKGVNEFKNEHQLRIKFIKVDNFNRLSNALRLKEIGIKYNILGHYNLLRKEPSGGQAL